MAQAQLTTRAEPKARFLNLPNLLTLSRVPLAGVPWISPGDLVLLLGVMALGAVTDVLDGWAARRLRARGRLADEAHSAGSWLDPVCDKFFVASLLVVIWVAARPPVWLLALVLTRDLVQAPVVALVRLLPPLRRRLAFDFRAAALGKATTVGQFLSLLALRLEHSMATPVVMGTAALGVASVFAYARRAVHRAGPAL